VSATVRIAIVIVIGISGIIVVAVPAIVFVVPIGAGIRIRLAIAIAAGGCTAVPASVVCAVVAVPGATRQQRESHSGTEYCWNPFHLAISG
jgi:hypothetical protein